MEKLPDTTQAAQFFENKMSFTTGPVELSTRLSNNDDINIIDVRMSDDYNKGHVPGAVNVPMDQWETTDKLSKGKLNVVYCYSHVCHLAAKASVQFAKNGYPVMELDGGFKSWQGHDLNIEQ